MFLIVPTGTNAPLYHLPWTTGGLILANILGLVLQFAFPGSTDAYMLIYGHWNPVTWLTSIFMHAGVGHLLGNLIGIGLFGWIIEGRVGWWRFLLIYLAVGVLGCAIEQTLMLFAEGSSVGASGAVFGLIAMAMLWAPENDINLSLIGWFIIRPIFFSFEASVLMVGFCMISFEFLLAVMTGFEISSAILHLIGTIPGFVIAYLMIKLRRVDCDGLDLISILRGKRGHKVLTVEQEREQETRLVEERQKAQAAFAAGLKMVEKYIDEGHYEVALQRFQLLRRQNPSRDLPEALYVALIQAFDANPDTKLKTIPLIESYLEVYDRYQISFTLMLARTLVVSQERPRKSLKVLQTLPWDQLSAEQLQFAQRVGKRAKEMIASGILETQD